MKNLLPIFIVLLFVCTSFVGESYTAEKSSTIYFSGKTLYVGGSGPGNYSKIQAAIDNANEGDTVFVYDDSSPYYENLVVDKSITLIGEDRNTTIIDGGGKKTAVKITEDLVTICFFTITRGGDNFYDSGIRILSSHNTIFSSIIRESFNGISFDSVSSNNLYDNIIIENYKGLYIESSGNNYITNNYINNNGEQIRLSASKNNYLIGNTIYSKKYYYEVYIYRSKELTVNNNSFFNCGINPQASTFKSVNNNTVNNKPLVFLVDESNLIIEEAGQNFLNNCSNITVKNLEISNVTVGILCEKTNFCNFSNNTFLNNKKAIELESSDSNIVGNNIITSGYEAVRMSNSKNNRIINNNFVQSGWTYLYMCKNISVMSNTFTGVSEEGIYLQSSLNCMIANNIIQECRVGIFLEILSENNLIFKNEIRNNKFFGILLAHSSNKNTIICNNFINNHPNVFLKRSNNNDWNENYWNKPRFFPKLIIGLNEKRLFIPYITFDWHPAREPYNIEV